MLYLLWPKWYFNKEYIRTNTMILVLFSYCRRGGDYYMSNCKIIAIDKSAVIILKLFIISSTFLLWILNFNYNKYFSKLHKICTKISFFLRRMFYIFLNKNGYLFFISILSVLPKYFFTPFKIEHISIPFSVFS